MTVNRSARGNTTADEASPPHDACWRNSTWRGKVRRRLIDWFDTQARDLPWRTDPTRYRVWVSEIMLQQTQVATVLPYYKKFIDSFPDIASLAAADESTLLRHWEGLGYYRRARSMHAAARQIVDQHDGEFPENYDDVLALPGIGRYTAGAILSIANDQRWPILEGNTQRVFSRWVGSHGELGTTATTKFLWQIATAMLPRHQVGKFNQAAMELGALVCTPKQPTCDQCPVQRMCCARRDGLQEVIPGKVSKVQYEQRDEYVLIVRRGARFLLRPLPEGQRWAGLWDFPRTTDRSYESVAKAADDLSKAIGIPVRSTGHLTTLRHAVTKYRISLEVHHAKLIDGRRKPPRPWEFVSPSRMTELPMSVTARKIAKLLVRS